MTLLRRLGSVVWWLLNRNRAEQGLEAEIQAFIDMSTADKIRSGVAPWEAGGSGARRH